MPSKLRQHSRSEEQTVPKTLFKRDFQYWESAVYRAKAKGEMFRSVYQDYLHAAGAPYYTREDQIEGYGTNWHYPTARGVVASLMFSAPEWEALNPNPELRGDAEAIENIDSMLWEKLQWSRVMRMVLYYTYFTGFGATRTEFIRGTDAPQQLSPSKEKVDKIFRALQLRQETTIDGVELARLIEGIGEPVYQNSMELRGFPHWRRVRSSRFLMDPDVVEYDFNDARWMGERIWLPLEFVRNTELYDKRPRNRVEGQARVKDRELKFKDRNGGSADEMWVEIAEIYDKVNQRIITLQMDQQIVLRSRPFDGSEPYDVLFWNPLPEQDAPIPDAALVFDHAMGKSALRSRVNRIIDSHRNFTTYDAEMVNEPETLQMMLHGNDALKLPITVPNGKRLSDAIHNDRSIPLSQELIQYDSVLTGEIQQAIGASPATMNLPRGGRISASQIHAEQQGQRTNLMDKTLEVEDFLARHITRVTTMWRNNWSPEMIAQYSGKRDNDTEVRGYFAEVRKRLSQNQPINDLAPVLPRKTILGEYVLRPRPGSTTFENAAQTQQVDRLDYLDMMANPNVSNVFATRYYFERKRRIRGVAAAMPAGDQAPGMGEFEAINAQQGDPLAQPQQPEAVNQRGGQGMGALSLLPGGAA